KGTVPSAVGFDFGGAVLLQNAGGVFGAVVVVRFYDAQNAALLHVLFILPAAILGNAHVQQSPADASRHRARQRRGQRPRGDDGPDAGNRQGAHAGQKPAQSAKTAAPGDAFGHAVHAASALASARTTRIFGDDRDFVLGEPFVVQRFHGAL